MKIGLVDHSLEVQGRFWMGCCQNAISQEEIAISTTWCSTSQLLITLEYTTRIANAAVQHLSYYKHINVLEKCLFFISPTWWLHLEMRRCLRSRAIKG